MPTNSPRTLRDPLIDTPDWRYGVARAELDREQGGLPVYEPSDDVYVLALKRMLPFRTVKAKYMDPMKRVAMHCIKGLELITRIYEDQSIGGLRDTMEAVLLAKDAELEFFQGNVSRKLTVDLIRMYRDVYYDIDESRDMPFWVQRNLFVPNRNISNTQKFDSAYMWKVVAYHGGVESLSQFAIDGRPLSDELRMWFRKMGVSEYVKQVLKSSHSYAKLLDSAGTPALPQAATWEKKQDTGTGESDDTAGAAAALAEAIDVPALAVTKGKELITEKKFSNEDNAK